MTCNRCGSHTSCNCRSCSSVPYYQTADVCPEDNCQKIYEQQFSFGLCSSTGWNVPSCWQTAVIEVGNLLGASVGSYVWHETYGYFKITSVDVAKGTIGITNTCVDGNAAPGTQIPPCTCFVVTVPPVDISENTGACVEIDFTAPAECDCIDIIVSSTAGLTVSDTIQIGSGFYFLDAIKPDNVITICNHGEGIVPGTAVIAKGANGEYQYCISVVSTNPCDRDALTTGKILGCDEDGIMRPFGTPCEEGYIPVVIDNKCNVEMRPGLDPLVCTKLSAALDIASGDATYVLEVENSSGLTVNDSVTFSGMPGTRGDITAIPDATHIEVTLDPVPGANQTLPVGTLICRITCCEFITNYIFDDLVPFIDCLTQGTRLSIPAQFNSQTITLVPFGEDGGGIYEVVLDSSVIEYTAPDDCVGATYHVRAEVNIGALIDFAPFAASLEAAILSSEIQLDWSNNVGVGGRFNWTHAGNDGVDLTGAYPATTLNALWGILQILNNTYPTTYAGGYVIADTLVAAGDTITLRMNFKTIAGDNVAPDDVFSMASYLIGNLVITRIT